MTNLLLPSTRNITRVYRSATDAQVSAGLAWYADAHAEAATLADAYGVSVDAASGIIAALSPLNSWGNNVRLARRFIAEGGLTSGYLSVGLGKARAILGGADAASVLTSPKVAAFYECIRTAGQTDAVCVDRHAFDIAVNTRQTDAERPALTGKRYAAIADAYRAASARLGVAPAQAQAVTWLTWRRRYWAEGAYDLRESA